MNTIAMMKNLTEDRGLNLFQLSQICDIPYSTLKNAETRNSQLSMDSIERICVNLGIPVYEFFMTDEDWAEIEDYALKRAKAREIREKPAV